MTENPNYYAIIPAKVRYDNRLCPNAKLLYAEITALCNMNGKCFATNAYFASLFGVTNKAVSLWVKSLIDFGYIQSEIVYKEGTKEILHRYVKILGEGVENILHTPMEKNFPDNNNLLDNKNNTLTESIKKERKKSENYEKSCRFENSKFFSDDLPVVFDNEYQRLAKDNLAISQINPFDEYEVFKDYWASKGGNATKTDWVATWRNWLRNKKVGYQPKKQKSLQETIDELSEGW